MKLEKIINIINILLASLVIFYLIVIIFYPTDISIKEENLDNYISYFSSRLEDFPQTYSINNPISHVVKAEKTLDASVNLVLKNLIIYVYVISSIYALEIIFIALYLYRKGDSHEK